MSKKENSAPAPQSDPSVSSSGTAVPSVPPAEHAKGNLNDIVNIHVDRAARLIGMPEDIYNILPSKDGVLWVMTAHTLQYLRAGDAQFQSTGEFFPRGAALAQGLEVVPGVRAHRVGRRPRAQRVAHRPAQLVLQGTLAHGRLRVRYDGIGAARVQQQCVSAGRADFSG